MATCGLWLLYWTYRMKVLVAHLCLTLCGLMDHSLPFQSLLFIVFSRYEYWSGLPFPSPGNLLNPGIKPMPPAWQADS